MARKGLTPKQQRFFEEYCKDFNATRAYKTVYNVSQQVAEANGPRLLGNARVQSALQNWQARMAERTNVTAEKVLREYARIAFAESRTFFEWGPDGVTLRPCDELSADDVAAVAEVQQTWSETGGSLKLKLHDKKGALDSLAKHLGLFKDGNINLNMTTVVRLPHKPATADAWVQHHQNGHAKDTPADAD